MRCGEAFSIWNISDHLNTKKMCDGVVDIKPWLLKYVSGHLKTRRMCDKPVREDTFSLQYIPDWIAVLQEMWYEDFDDDDDELIEWYEGYKKRKVQKAKIKKELMPIAWHPDRVMDWCISEDEKRWRN